jgi:SAM-dependent methyltransferase
VNESPARLSLEPGFQLAHDIKALAHRAAELLPPDGAAGRMARRRIARPVDYMRYAEFSAVMAELTLEPGTRLLDISSPQWFSLYLASTHPDIHVTYINIMESELVPFAEIARALDLDNIEHRVGDARELEFDDGSFDRVVSISVLEHVYPEVGGDLAAFSEITRVLNGSGELVLSVPYKSAGTIVYVDGPAYERDAQARNFFAREYDATTFAALIAESPLSLVSSWFVCEKQGFWAVDYYEWGPGTGHGLRSTLIRKRAALQLLTGTSVDGPLARRYLFVSREPENRLVNIVARLRPSTGA